MRGLPGYDHNAPLAAGEEYDDDEASYDSQDYDDDMDEEDEMVSRARVFRPTVSSMLN